ncbi:MAG TPA: hypothetical protein VLI39_12615 [Sedimentisphaerales bacterium]|nr:hypothetical protein [Sedimentisphaerales bacterium]
MSLRSDGEKNLLILGLSKLLPDLGTTGMTNSLMLSGWGLKGLLGHMCQYAGRTIRCVARGQRVVIPQKSDFFGPAAEPAHTPPRPDLSIRFACACGRRIKAPARYAGRIGKCPQCGSQVRIPRASA